jgi:hypothetical protein
MNIPKIDIDIFSHEKLIFIFFHFSFIVL